MPEQLRDTPPPAAHTLTWSYWRSRRSSGPFPRTASLSRPPATRLPPPGGRDSQLSGSVARPRAPRAPRASGLVHKSGRGDPMSRLPSSGRVWAALGPGRPRQRDPGPGRGLVRQPLSLCSGRVRGKPRCGRTRRVPASPLRSARGPRVSQDPLALARPAAGRPPPRRWPRSFPASGRRAGPRSCGVRLEHGGVAHAVRDSISARRVSAQPLGTPGGRRARGRGRSSARGPRAAPQADASAPIPERDAAPKFSPAASASQEEDTVRSGRPNHPAAGTGAPTPAPGIRRWPAGSSRLTKGSGAAPNAGSPRLQRPLRREPRTALRAPGPSAAAAAACSCLLLRHFGDAPDEGVALRRPWVGELREAPVTWRRKEERRRCAPAEGAPGTFPPGSQLRAPDQVPRRAPRTPLPQSRPGLRRCAERHQGSAPSQVKQTRNPRCGELSDLPEVAQRAVTKRT